MLVFVLALIIGLLLPPTLMWLNDLKLCTDVRKCDNCPVHASLNTKKFCKEVGKYCSDVHFCCTRKWL